MQTLGPYQLYQRLGAGATAEVFLAAGPNPRGAELIALKVMLESQVSSRSSTEMFLREARTSALLRHKHLVEIFEVGEVSGRPFIAMELVRGWSVSALLKKMKDSKETFAIDEACEVVRQAALGLHYIHEVRGTQGQVLGLIHRDVSPQNLIIDEQGLVKVVDYGLAKATAEVTQTRSLKGKIRYMAPEQLKGEGLDRRIDIFALGAILWELVCGQPLHPGPSEAEVFQQAFFNAQPHPDEVKRGLPRAVVEVLRTAVARDKTRRYATAAAMAEVLSGLAGVDVTSRLAARLLRHFERLPRTHAELMGPLAPPRPGGPRSQQLPAPPGKMQARARSTEVTEPEVNAKELFAKVRARDAQRQQAELAEQTLPVPPVRMPDARPTDTGVAVEFPSGEVAPKPEVTDQSLALSGPDVSSISVVARTMVGGPAAGRGLVWGVAVLVGVSLVIGGFALARRLFPGTSGFEELAPPDAPQADDGEFEPLIADAKKAAPKGPAVKKIGKGRVRFITNEPAEVFIGNKRYGLSNEVLTLPAGRHRVELVVPGGAKSASTEVDVLAGTTSDLRVTLQQ